MMKCHLKYVNIIHLEDETIEKKERKKEINRSFGCFQSENRGEERNDDSNKSNLR